mmetsp:Transcript_21281/g.46184  ORF Transcript_21281/g.46184 Transcript_21281/m.46184 type:complete len:82 (+) Transcript_21281:770-1015(+)
MVNKVLIRGSATSNSFGKTDVILQSSQEKGTRYRAENSYTERYSANRGARKSLGVSSVIFKWARAVKKVVPAQKAYPKVEN